MWVTCGTTGAEEGGQEARARRGENTWEHGRQRGHRGTGLSKAAEGEYWGMPAADLRDGFSTKNACYRLLSTSQAERCEVLHTHHSGHSRNGPGRQT